MFFGYQSPSACVTAAEESPRLDCISQQRLFAGKAVFQPPVTMQSPSRQDYNRGHSSTLIVPLNVKFQQMLPRLVLPAHCHRGTLLVVMCVDSARARAAKNES